MQGVHDLMSRPRRPDRSCRMIDDDGRACRRPKTHKIHAEHVAGCPVASSLHHTYVAARRSYGSFKADPFVRTSMLIRKSSLDYLKRTYGEMATRIRELIAADQGITGARLRHYIGEPIKTPRQEDGQFLPKEAAGAIDEIGAAGQPNDAMKAAYLGSVHSFENVLLQGSQDAVDRYLASKEKAESTEVSAADDDEVKL